MDFKNGLSQRGLVLAEVIFWTVPLCAYAQPPQGSPPTPKATAPIDLTGYWVSVVTEDWRWRMLTPPKGDYESVPMTEEARRVANAWDPANDEAAGNQCKAYGAANIMRIPERLHITWDDDNTLRIETDAGKQTRILHFNGQVPSGETPSWQGYSKADWYWVPGWTTGVVVMVSLQAPRRERGEGFPGRSLEVVTTHMRPGYLRKNGVPYSGNAVLTEYFDRFDDKDRGDAYLMVTAIVDDPQYLNQPFITSTHFKKQADATGWNPAPCTSK